MPGKEFLREQIERARRLAKALTRTEDRDRLLALAEDYQRQLDATSRVPAQAEQSVPDEQAVPDTQASDQRPGRANAPDNEDSSGEEME